MTLRNAGGQAVPAGGLAATAAHPGHETLRTRRHALLAVHARPAEGASAAEGPRHAPLVTTGF